MTNNELAVAIATALQRVDDGSSLLETDFEVAVNTIEQTLDAVGYAKPVITPYRVGVAIESAPGRRLVCPDDSLNQIYEHIAKQLSE